jgi:hypothetical protein
VKKLILLAAAVLAAAVFFLLATLPPRPVTLSLNGADQDLLHRTVRGAYHIHTTRSDGAETKSSVAAAAARAGLQFAIFTDHGDGTSAPDAPAYIDGVLCVDGVEISTNGGHYVALDMPATPYPLGGEAAAVVEDVHRLGGFGIAAHPDHPKRELAWTDWRAPVDGIEWLNADSEWRDETRAALVRALFDYLLRPPAALASMLDRPNATLDRWAVLTQKRQVVGLAAADAHGGARGSLEGETGAVIGGPSYEASFRTFSNRVILDRGFSGDAAADARTLLHALRRGRVYTVIDAIAAPVLVNVQARVATANGERVLEIGDRAAGPATGSFDVDVAGFIEAAGSSTVPRTAFGGPPVRHPARLSDLRPVNATATAKTLAPGANFIEVPAPGAPGNPAIPWILTNPIYVLPEEGGEPAIALPAMEPLAAAWRIENDRASSASLRSGDGSVVLTYGLGAGIPANQFAALVADIPRPQSTITHVAFKGSASRPMRVSVQLRFPPDGRRWRKSIYLDSRARDVVVPVDEMVPADGPSGAAPREGAQSLLFVVDLVNAKPGDAGSVVIDSVRISSR